MLVNDTPAPTSEKHNAPASEQQMRDAMVERLIELGPRAVAASWPRSVRYPGT